MSKRSLEEDTEVNREQRTKSKTKKQKILHDGRLNAENEAEGLTKAQRKEKRRLKKQKEKEDAENQSTDTTETLQDSSHPLANDSSNVDAQSALAKAARKAEKKLLKALKKETQLGPTDNEPGSQLSKAERKAERKRRKALKVESATGDERENADSRTLSTTAKEQGSVIKSEKKSKRNKSLPEKPENMNGTTIPKQFAYEEAISLAERPQSDVDKFMSSNFISIHDPTTAKVLRPIMEFSQLPRDAHPSPSPFSKFKTPTPIQAASWPFLLSGRDVIGVAETGSGKTLAFGVPCIRHIVSLPKKSKGSPAKAVIVSPTRELAVQIHEQIVSIAKPAGLQAVCVYGGVPKESQRMELKTAHIIIATPGRLNDFVDEGTARLGEVSYLVLDEADRMLDKGFEDAIRKIASATGSASSRQTLMFTATWPPSVRDLASTFMRQPVKIAIGDNPSGELRANTRIQQKVEVIDPRGKEQRLLQLLKQYQTGIAKNNRILVFCLYKKEASRVEALLRSKGLRVAGIHGDLSQEKRTASLDSFREGKTPLLVATDVAARGLDIPDVKVVINMTFPLTVEDYVHRIGRTGRAGAEGLAITLFTEHDKPQSGALINVLKAAQQPVPEELFKFGTTVKKKAHDAYGAFYKENTDGKEATKIKFDD